MKAFNGMLIILLVMISFSIQAQDREFVTKEGDKEFHMKKYFMLLYTRGDNSESFTEDELAELQKLHLEHINYMAEKGWVKIAGPFEGDHFYRGVLIFDVDTEEEVKKLIDQDESVKKGRLSYEIYPWWTEKGACLE